MRLGGWVSVIENDPTENSNTFNNSSPVGSFLNNKNQTPDEVLNRYITLGKSERSRINGSVERLTPVKYLSLTGFEFESKSEQSSEVVKVIKHPVVSIEEPVKAVRTQSQLKTMISTRKVI